MKWKDSIFKKSRTETRSPSSSGIIEFINTDKFLMGDNAPDILRPEKITLPEWYKKLPILDRLKESDQFDDLTAKRCIPILDALTTGYYLVTTTDYTFEYDKEQEIGRFSGNAKIMEHKPISMHPITQLSTVNLSSEYIKYAYKWSNSWTIKTPEGYSCLFVHPLDGLEFPFKSLDGVVDTDKYFMPVLFPFLMKNNFSGTIPAGTPVIQIIPFKRDDWSMKIVEDMSDDLKSLYKSERDLYEGQRYGKNMEVFGGMYKRDYRVKKKYT